MCLTNFDPINAVFDNEIILDKILNNVSKDVFPLIPLRVWICISSSTC
ncbi:Ferrochelatase [Caenorhabditis elegans]|uniref:Ferrochelatase n=1 Tax=Caenorhabditis elegans TaxID=6239 RepID=A0A2C9C307_CAEEL|nr:Ferrochelatase [Caenorhabditis elegans]SOF58742.1 Ferrochelatase [Caenorhabditis elegans]|eukprot:NP_001343750.1 Uncharacterized protein CELE_C27H5.12 [Caenorhabditis elegans]